MCLPLPLHCWHVWCYVRRSIQHLFTLQMFSVRAVQWYNLSHTTTKSTLLFVSNDSSSHSYAISRSTSQCTDQHHTSCRNTWSLFASAVNTRDIGVVCFFPFESQCSECFDFQSSELGRSWTWSAPWWRATGCHISFLRMDNQFANEIFTEIFCASFCCHMTCV